MSSAPPAVARTASSSSCKLFLRTVRARDPSIFAIDRIAAIPEAPNLNQYHQGRPRRLAIRLSGMPQGASHERDCGFFHVDESLNGTGHYLISLSVLQ